MHVKIQGGGKNKGVHANTGSSASLVSYLQHEDAERLAEGKEVFPFFTGTGVALTPGEVIEKLDRNKKKLSKTDAKFFHIDINPSKDEIPYLGSTDEEIVANATIFCQKLTDEYAKNFNHEKIHGAEDIMIFFKPHFSRDDSKDLEFHLHAIVSRKDIHNQVKLSPMSNHRGTSNGPVKGGFDRKKFQESCERVFDENFGYERKVADTFAYKLAMKKGTVEEKAVQEERMPDAEKKELITQQADLIMPGVSTLIENGYKRLGKSRRDKFWNEYHSKYQPVYETVKKACDDTYRLYLSAKEQYGLTSREISEQYKILNESYSKMREHSENLKRIQKTRKLVNAASAVLLLVNPTAALALKLTASIIAKAKTSASIEAKKDLHQKAESIRQTIEDLKQKQADLRQQNADRLAEYLENKEAKINLQAEISALKAELEALRKSEQKSLSQRRQELVEKYISSESAQNLLNIINKSGYAAGHYHLVPGILENKGNDIFRWILFEDGCTADNKQVYTPRPASQQSFGESYIEFSFNEKGELMAVIEADNYQGPGLSGQYNLRTGKGKVSERKYVGRKKDYEAKKNQTYGIPPKKKGFKR